MARSRKDKFQEEMDRLEDFFRRMDKENIPILRGDYQKLH